MQVREAHIVKPVGTLRKVLYGYIIHIYCKREVYVHFFAPMHRGIYGEAREWSVVWRRQYIRDIIVIASRYAGTGHTFYPNTRETRIFMRNLPLGETELFQTSSKARQQNNHGCWETSDRIKIPAGSTSISKSQCTRKTIMHNVHEFNKGNS